MKTYPKNDLLIRAAKRKPVERTPIWLMRQAGRYMPEYRELREKAGDFKRFYKDVELSVKATLLPYHILGVDALIIFSDILTPLESIGMKFEFKEGEGPVFENPIRTADDIEKLREFDVENVSFVGRIIEEVRKEIDYKLPVIGFCGAPFTLAAYMIEGKTSRDFKKTKVFMYERSDEFKRLLNKLTDMLIEYLNFQIKSGADAVQISLKRDYQPVIHFTKGVAGFFEDMITSGADVYSVDWMVDLKNVKKKLNSKAAVQGNLDPIVLYAGKNVIKREAIKILEKWGNDTGHIFNLGHGLMPDMSVENVKFLVDVVKEESRR